MADEQQEPQEPKMTFELTARNFAVIMSGLNTQTILSIQTMQNLKNQSEVSGFAEMIAESVTTMPSLKEQTEKKAAEEQAAAAAAGQGSAANDAA